MIESRYPRGGCSSRSPDNLHPKPLPEAHALCFSLPLDSGSTIPGQAVLAPETTFPSVVILAEGGISIGRQLPPPFSTILTRGLVLPPFLRGRAHRYEARELGTRNTIKNQERTHASIHEHKSQLFPRGAKGGGRKERTNDHTHMYTPRETDAPILLSAPGRISAASMTMFFM